MKHIDLQTWPRRSQYHFFRQLVSPHFSVTVPLDATHLMQVLKPAGVSVFNATLFAVTVAANEIAEFRTRFRAHQVVEHEVVHPSVTVPLEAQQFAFCDLEFCAQWSEFDRRCRLALEQARAQRELRDEGAHRDDWLYLSCLPWLAFTAVTNPTNGADDCIPRIAWGRLELHDRRWRMPVSVQAHHALLDGVHVAQFLDALQQRLVFEP